MEKITYPSCPNCLSFKWVSLKLKKGNFRLFLCSCCFNGFTYPSPKNFKKYYSDQYWISKGLVGSIKDTFYNIFQLRRKKWLTRVIFQGEVLDVGSGEGRFGKSLSDNYSVTNLDPFFNPPPGGEKGISVIKKNFLKWKTSQKFNAIVFWESLEHVISPLAYMRKANKLLKKNGKIFIECPRFDSLESTIFGRNWFHLDMPRHVSHLTSKGIKILLIKSKFKDIQINSIIAPEYTLWGFIASIFSFFSINVLDSVKSGNLIIFLITLPFLDTFLANL